MSVSNHNYARPDFIAYDDCDAHAWVANSGRGGEPRFTPSPIFGPQAPHAMHVMCDRCGTRTWLTEAQWAALGESPCEGQADG